MKNLHLILGVAAIGYIFYRKSKGLPIIPNLTIAPSVNRPTVLPNQLPLPTPEAKTYPTGRGNLIMSGVMQNADTFVY